MIVLPIVAKEDDLRMYRFESMLDRRRAVDGRMWGEDVEPQGALRRPSRRQFGIVLTELQKVGVVKNERQGSSDRITAPNDVLLSHC